MAAFGVQRTSAPRLHVPVAREIPFDAPHAVYARLRRPKSFLFESLRGGVETAHYSFIGLDPYLTFRLKDGCVEIEALGRRSVFWRNPLQKLRELVAAHRQQSLPDLPPFQGGAAGMFSYDFVHCLERLPKNAVDDLKVPDAHFYLFDRVVAFDHRERRSWIIVCPGARDTVVGYSESVRDRGELIAEAEAVIGRIHGWIAAGGAAASRRTGSGQGREIVHDVSREQYVEMVRRAKQYIAAGDIFQANLSLRVSAAVADREPWDIYSVLREINPSPFAAFVDFGDYQIISSSPERLARVRGGVIDTRPIAGTRPRGRDLREDEIMRAELLLNEKERAEHVMLIDLERNDLGKVSRYGSVVVDEFMVTEAYSHVIHIVSNVRGELAPGKDCFSAVRAVFPGGTITGVPKVRCMEIIDELEPTRRGPYTGSIGYIGFNGSMDLNIVIRTMLVKDGRAYVQAGAGIVADSDPEREYFESLRKAEALIQTLTAI